MIEENIVDENSLKWTNNSHYYNKKIKFKRAVNCEIKCGLCPYNKHENSNHYPRKSWKHWRNTQYKPI